MTPLILTIAFYGLELFVGIIQAFIFAVLTLVFGMMAVSHGEANAAEREHEEQAGAMTPEAQG
jgi:F-type H+-transporting ATPase subunit a